MSLLLSYFEPFDSTGPERELCPELGFTYATPQSRAPPWTATILETVEPYPLDTSHGTSRIILSEGITAGCPKQLLLREEPRLPKAACQHFTFLSSDNLGPDPDLMS